MCNMMIFKCGKSPIFKQDTEVYGGCMMNEVSVLKWRILFIGGRTNIPVVESKSRPSVVTDEMKAKIEVKVYDDRHGCTHFY